MRKLRRIQKGAVYLITKKCNDDLFFLVPDPQVDRILLFSMLATAAKYGVLIHGFCFLSNHFHMVVTDQRARLPDCMRDFLTNSSKALKVQLRESRSIWSRERYSAVLLLDLDAAQRKLAYVILNPTRAGLVAQPQDWPGLTSVRWNVGDTIEVDRPPLFFSEQSYPERISMKLQSVSLAFGVEQQSCEECVQELVRVGTRAIHGEMKARGESFAGADAVLRTSRHKRSTHPVRTRNPRFATRDRLLLQQAIAEDREFHRRHAEAKTKYRAGKTRTIFPAGTYWHRVFLGVRVEGWRTSA